MVMCNLKRNPVRSLVDGSFCGSLLVLVMSGKVVGLRITLNIVGAPIVSRSHTHPSHSQTSRLLTSSLSLGVSVPRATQCM